MGKLSFFEKELSKDFEFYRKQGMQLTSKMRYISAQFNAFLEHDLWKKNAGHANEMAQYLKNELRKIPEVNIVQNAEANMVFAYIPKQNLQQLRKKFFFHVSDDNDSVARLMCSFNTTKESIDELVKHLRCSLKSTIAVQ